ncbi:MAG: 3-isopropylmalate dehydratase small subunit [Thermodesulfobacteriota bacterium]
MEKFEKIQGIVAPLDRMNVDTDQIIPKQFLKRIERTGFGEFLFFDWRYSDDGSLNSDFVLNEKRYNNANILLTRDNFGSGSSREHAPWAIKEYGFRVIISPSFADIFYNNCFKNSILPIILPENDIKNLFEIVFSNEGFNLAVDLDKQSIKGDLGIDITFDIDSFKKKVLLEGLDDISQTLQHENYITNYENTLKTQRNWFFPDN